MLLGAFPYHTLLGEMGSKPDLREHKRTTIDALHTAKLFVRKIAKQPGRSRAFIRRYIKKPKKFEKNHGGKKNSKMSP